MRVGMAAVGLVAGVAWGAIGCGPSVGETGDGAGTTGSTSTSADTTLAASASASTGPVGDGTTTTAAPTTTGTPDDGPWLDVPPDLPGECTDWATMGCGTPSPRAVVMGATPQGDFETTLAVFGGMIGCAGWCDGALSSNIQRIVLAADPAVLEGLEPFHLVDETLVIEFDVFEGPLGVPVDAQLWANRDGMSSQGFGAQVVIDLLPTGEQLAEPFDPGTAVVVTGSVTLEAPGWSVAGTFAASYCPQINEYYICE